MGVCGFFTSFLKAENEHSLGNFISFNLFYIRFVTYVTLDLSKYILQNYNIYTVSNCNNHEVVIHME